MFQHEEVDNFAKLCLPQHCGMKQDNATTKLPKVFDASAKTTSCFNLNERFLVCPKVQKLLFSNDLRMRYFKLALFADIKRCIGKLSSLNRTHFFIDSCGASSPVS